MSYRYNMLDVIVGIGLCAIVFGAVLFFAATSGQFVFNGPQSALIEEGASESSGMVWLQPALGQAIVERTLLQRQTDQITAAAATEWNQAMVAHRSLRAGKDQPFEFVMQRAAVIPVAHEARVQGVMGRQIVNFTKRGIGSGALSPDQYVSDFNRDMIGRTEATGLRLHEDFTATWQPLLGRWIVDASRDSAARAAGVQEQLGSAIIHMEQARTGLEQAWAANQYQLGSLMAAVDRSGYLSEKAMAPTGAQGVADGMTVASTGALMRREIPLGVLMAAALGLCSLFVIGLMWSAAGREAKALAEAQRNAARWVFRMAA